jgi:hypothetical protein
MGVVDRVEAEVVAWRVVLVVNTSPEVEVQSWASTLCQPVKTMAIATQHNVTRFTHEILAISFLSAI